MNHFSADEIATLRADTPGTKNVVHFNNAGASLMPSVVTDKIIEYINHESGYGGYETAEKYHSEINNVYTGIAHYLGCDQSEIAIMENATAAWGQAFLSIPLTEGDSVLTSVSEYASNYIGFLQLKRRMNIQVEVVPNDKYGQLDVSVLAEMMHPRVKLIAVSHVPTNGGLVNPAAEIGAIARKHDVWYLLDACQSVGQMPINVKQLGCDFLSATSRKYLRGPRGVGFLYISNEKIHQLEPPILDLHGAHWVNPESYQPRTDAKKFENWESNLSAVLGLATAVEYMLELGADRIWDRVQYLAEHLRKQLVTVPGVAVHDLGKTKCGIVSFTAPKDPQETAAQLRRSGYNVSLINPNHTLLDMTARGLGFMIRASLHYYNTVEEVDQFIDRLKNL